MESRGVMARRFALALGALALVGIGMGAGVLWNERRATGRAPSDVVPSAATTAKDAAPASPARSDEPIEVSLTAEAIRRAGIKTATVGSGTTAATLTVPGTVTSNAYRDSKVNALVGGVVRQVAVELGTSVRRGDRLAIVFSNELAEAQMKYLSMRAMVEADHRKVERTRELLAMGAVARQQFEEVAAIHEGHVAELAAHRQHLLLLGLTGDQIGTLRDPARVVSEVPVDAPTDGTVLARSVNPGQVVAAGQELFVVADLSTVWVIGDVYEKDFGALTVGSSTTIIVPSAPDRPIRGRVAYIDPRVDAAARTAKVRIEVPNADRSLRLGMFVQVRVAGAAGPARAVVPRAAVQTIGSRSVVYVAGSEEGRFAERTVRLGAGNGDVVEVLEGVKPGERVATEGSFLLRAEAARVRGSG
jgi:cobalt-zinc-cadmium efflux system membrane fusion protein